VDENVIGLLLRQVAARRIAYLRNPPYALLISGTFAALPFNELSVSLAIARCSGRDRYDTQVMARP
jgi:hypothetical protein